LRECVRYSFMGEEAEIIGAVFVVGCDIGGLGEEGLMTSDPETLRQHLLICTAS
jgi:hypothetical protein